MDNCHRLSDCYIGARIAGDNRMVAYSVKARFLKYLEVGVKLARCDSCAICIAHTYAPRAPRTASTALYISSTPDRILPNHLFFFVSGSLKSS